jgi:hypothetical protein
MEAAFVIEVREEGIDMEGRVVREDMEGIESGEEDLAMMMELSLELENL